MNNPSFGPHSSWHGLSGLRVAVLGYGDVARQHALALRRAGNDVVVGLRLGGTSWVRAQKDGFEAQHPCVVVGGAQVVVMLVPDEEQPSVYHHVVEPQLAPGSLLVFARGLALETGAIDPRGHDVALVTGLRDGDTSCRVAVHRNATGHALARANAYALALFGERTPVGTTTISAEAEAELAALAEHAGGRGALLESIERSAAHVGRSHAPDEARFAFYEGLRDLVERPRSSLFPVPPSSRHSAIFFSSNGYHRGAC